MARRRFRPTARRKMIWARTPTFGFTSIPSTGTAFDLLAAFRTDGGSTLGATVTRVHISLQLNWGEVTQDNRMVHGLLVDQLQQAETQVPRPVAEPHADWMYWESAPMLPEFAAATYVPPADPDTRLVASHRIDAKSQRKCEELGQTLWYVLDPSFGASGEVIVQAAASVLLKLP